MTARPDLTILAGTAGGLHALGPAEQSELPGREITGLARDGQTWWALLDGRTLWRRDGGWTEVAAVEGPQATCLAARAGDVWVGTAGAHLLRLEAGRLAPVTAFETAEGRSAWYTPWGDPADTRSIAVDPAGTIHVNVHVGGVARSTDGGRTWRPTLDIETDVHQVLTHPERPGVVLAAAAVGLALSEDGGATWRIETDGLHAPYARAVAVSGDTLFLSASTGPRTRRAALYQRRLGGPGPFLRCQAGLPEWFPSNLDTGCVAAAGPAVAFGTETGEVFLSTDEGATWTLAAKGLPPVRCVALG